MLPRGKRRKRKKPSTLRSVILLAITAVLVISSGIWGDNGAKAEYLVSMDKIPKLQKAGPIGEYGYPVWYKDSNGKRFELCLDATDPLCGFAAGEFAVGELSVKNGNFHGEAFYQLAGAEFTLPSGGDAVATFALEAAWANEIVQDGDQIVFGRVRFRIDDLQIGKAYTISHPYGVDKIIATPADPDETGVNDPGEIRFVEDIGINGGFEGAKKSRIGTFLEWDVRDRGLPEGYAGDPGIDHKIINGYFNGTEEQNYFRIQGPGIGSDGTCGPDCVQTDLFSLMGKYATTAGVDVMRATYSQDTAGSGTIDVFASTEEDAQYSIDVTGNGMSATTMRGKDGQYFGHVPFTGAVPATVTVTNKSDNPQSTKELKPVDHITGTAKYDTNSDSLIITAASSDKLSQPTLTAKGFGDIPSSGTLVLNKPERIPPTITITSAKGGSESLPVDVTTVPASANAGANQTVKQGTVVTLDGSASTSAATFNWEQVSGPAVTLSDPATANPTFTFPVQFIPVSFKLTVTGLNGQSSTNESIVNITPAPDVLTVQSAIYSKNNTEANTTDDILTVTGNSDVGGVTISVYKGNLTNPKAVLIGKAPASSNGSWTVRKTGSSIVVSPGETLTIESSSGGKLNNVSVVTRLR
ncbi:PKD domain-containing protein [Neobacillus vireti]|uniref:PKD domain-containing protein n=1 Tax=Neobacillus vireti TaxID=220686 RepID=UPI002FFF79AF